MSNKAFAFMAFGKAQESTSGGRTFRYVGVGSVRVLAVNPTKEELARIYGNDSMRDVEYAKDFTDNAGVPHKHVRLDFIVRADPGYNNGIDVISRISFFVEDRYRVNGAGDKVQVIDRYGNTAWVTNEEYKVHAIPEYSNGPANLDKDYRPCHVGEEDLTNFLKNYLNIPSSVKREGDKLVMAPNPDAECRLDHIEDYLKGDYSELKGALALQPNNKVKVLFGVRNATDDKGNPRQYQTIYSGMTLRNYVKDYSRLEKEIKGRKAAGAFASTEFIFEDLREYKVSPTDLSSPKETVSDPFASGVANDPFASGMTNDPFAGGAAGDPFAGGMSDLWDNAM